MFWLTSVTRKEHESHIAVAQQRYPKIGPGKWVYFGRGVSVTKSGKCSVEVN